jgi:hypothetical protein
MIQLDFPVRRQPVKVDLPNGEVFVDPRKEALVRGDTSRVLGYCGRGYKVVRHGEAVTKLHRALEQGDYRFDSESVLTKHGARLFHKVRFPEIKVPVETPEDLVTLQIILENSLDGSTCFSLIAGGFRVACSNGLLIGKTYFKNQMKHTQSLDVGRIIRSVKRQVDSFHGILGPFWKALAEYEVKKEQGMDLIDQIAKETRFGERNARKVQAQWVLPRSTVTGGENLWGVYQAFTSHITHEIQRKHFQRGHLLGRKIVPAFRALVAN